MISVPHQKTTWCAELKSKNQRFSAYIEENTNIGVGQCVEKDFPRKWTPKAYLIKEISTKISQKRLRRSLVLIKETTHQEEIIFCALNIYDQLEKRKTPGTSSLYGTDWAGSFMNQDGHSNAGESCSIFWH